MPNRQRVAVDSNPNLAGIFDTVNSTLATPNPGKYLPPEFFDEKARHFMERIATEEEYRGFAESNEFSKLGIGEPLGEVVDRMVGKVRHNTPSPLSAGKGQRGPDKAIFALFACHDSTIAGMMTALGAMKPPNWFWPPYTSFLAVELFRRSAVPANGSPRSSPTDGLQLSDRFVRLSFMGRPLTLPACQARGNHLPGDESFCTLVSGVLRVSLARLYEGIMLISDRLHLKGW
jgi:acid phosphatase